MKGKGEAALVERDATPFNSYDLKTFLSSLIAFSLRITSSSSRGWSEEKKRSLWAGRLPALHPQPQRERMWKPLSVHGE